MKKVIIVIGVVLIIIPLVGIGYEWGLSNGKDRGFTEGSAYGFKSVLEFLGAGFLDKDIIYGTVELGDNAKITNSIIIAGEDGVVISGNNATISNCRMMVTDVFRGFYAVTNDPNEVEGMGL